MRQALRECGLDQPQLLEVGVGDDAFLRHLIQDGYPSSHLQALEFSPSGRAAIESLGVRCLAGTSGPQASAIPSMRCASFRCWSTSTTTMRTSAPSQTRPSNRACTPAKGAHSDSLVCLSAYAR
jgi:hypothetical protein